MFTQGTKVKFEVWVENSKDGTHLPELQIVNHPGDVWQPAHSECFIETIDDAFAVKLKVVSGGRKADQWESKCYIDGTDLRQGVWLDPKETQTFEYAYEKEAGGMVKRTLCFSPMPTASQTEATTLGARQLREVGNIRIKLRAGKWNFASSGARPATGLLEGKGDEKAKKFAYHVRAGSSMVASRTTNFYDFTPRDYDDYYHFTFRYRARPVLVKMGLIEEPEAAEQEGQQPPPAKKRRHSQVIDLSNSDDEDIKPTIKKVLQTTRIEYLQGQLRRLTGEVKTLRAQRGLEDGLTIDLTEN